jgi:hypothetical protein
MSTTADEVDVLLNACGSGPHSEEFGEVSFRIRLHGRSRTVSLRKSHLPFLTLHAEYLDLKIYPGGGGYPIEYYRMDDVPKTLKWVEHLTKKKNVAKEHLAAFLEVAKALRGEMR